VADPYLGWRGLRNFTGIFVKDDFRATIAFNEKGYRKKSSKITPRPGAKKLVVQGDSFAWGWGVGQGEVLTDILQDKLGPNINIINYGINTFGTVQEKIQLEREIVPLKPDWVCLMFYCNDFKDNLNGRNDNRPYCKVRGGEIVLKNYPIQNPIGSFYRSFTRISFVLTHLRYYHNYFKEYVKMAGDYLIRDTDEGLKNNPGEENGTEIPVNRESIAVLGHYIHLIQKICDQNHIRLFMVFVPTGENIGEKKWDTEYGYFNTVKEVCDENGILLLNLIPAFESTITGRNGEPMYFSDDPHWTAEGHRLAAEVIGKEIRKWANLQ
jgi:lysophospholipase L1-like esterase